MLDLSRPKVQLLNIAELGNIVWALAKWGYRPGPVWMTMFLGRCTYVLNELEMKHDASGGGAVAKARISSVVALRGGKALAVGSGDVRLTSTNIVGALTSLTWGLAMLRTKVNRGALIDPGHGWCGRKGARFPAPRHKSMSDLQLIWHCPSLQLPSELEQAVLIEAEVSVDGNTVAVGHRSSLPYHVSPLYTLLSGPIPWYERPGLGQHGLGPLPHGHQAAGALGRGLPGALLQGNAIFQSG